MSESPALSARIQVSLSAQVLRVYAGDRQAGEFPVSTSRYGPGEASGSLCTPRGRHVIRARIGAGLPPGTVLQGRRPTGETWSSALAALQPGRDWVLTRILWLSGTEVGRNRLGDVDSMQRYIYIHGTPDSEPMGVPFSHGCIRMRNDDVIQLFDMAQAGSIVDISA